MSSLKVGLMLDGLPVEVLLAITSYLGGQDLKGLRLCCKHLASIVEPRLFEDIVVVPYQESFGRLSHLAHHESLSTHVQGVTYDCRRLALRHERVDDSVSEWILTLSTATKTGRSSVMDEIAAFSQHCELHRTFLSLESDCVVEEERLRTALSALVKLQRVVVIGYDDNLHRLHPARFHQQMVKKAYLIPNDYESYLSEERVKLTLVALQESGRAISDLRLENVDWLALGPLQELLASVQHLRLWLQGADPLGPPIHDAYRQLGYCLNHPVRNNLQSLEIVFRPSSLWLEDLEQDDMTDVELYPAYLFNSKCYYPALRKLQISTYYIYEHDLLGFLARSSSTLISLTLEHICLLAEHQDLLPAANTNSTLDPPAWIRRPSACWVKVIKFLQSDMNLKHVSFLGTLVSSAQRWICQDQDSVHRERKDSFDQVSDRRQLRSILDSYPERTTASIVGWKDGTAGGTRHLLYYSQSCLRSRIQRFIVEGGDCPLDSVVAGAQLDSNGYKERVKLGSGDYSWKIIYPAMAEAGPTENVPVG